MKPLTKGDKEFRLYCFNYQKGAFIVKKHALHNKITCKNTIQHKYKTKKTRF